MNKGLIQLISQATSDAPASRRDNQSNPQDIYMTAAPKQNQKLLDAQARDPYTADPYLLRAQNKTDSKAKVMHNADGRLGTDRQSAEKSQLEFVDSDIGDIVKFPHLDGKPSLK